MYTELLEKDEFFASIYNDADTEGVNYSLKSIGLFGTSLVSATIEDTAKHLVRRVERTRVCFINAHCTNQMYANKDYERAVKSASINLPDGSGMSIAAKLVGKKFTGNLNGTDLLPHLLEEAASLGKSIFFLGAEEGNARGTALWAKRNYPHLKIAGSRHGYFSKDQESDVIKKINASKADILLVAMGVPHQDIWLQKNWDRLNVSLGMGVGGLFEYYSGQIPRAPSFIRKVGMEWVWRLAQEPRRLAKRYIVGNPLFLLHACIYAAQHHLRPRETPVYKFNSNRMLDLVISTAALVALSPVFLFAAVGIKITSKGAVFFTQNRVGQDGKTFKLYKFRSMGLDAEIVRSKLIAKSDRSGICYKMKGDPRVTSIGKFLRRFSLDELPQLLNVLKGEMSIVGPRPALECEVAQYTETQRQRLSGKPGITGLWQIAGRADIPFEHQADMDIAYVKSRTLLSDILIILLTPVAIISGKGAY